MSSSGQKVKIKIASKFEHSFKKLPEVIQKEAIAKKDVFQNNPFDKSLGTHKLKGKLKNIWSFSVNKSYRIIFDFTGKDTVLFYDIGDHRIYK